MCVCVRLLRCYERRCNPEVGRDTEPGRQCWGEIDLLIKSTDVRSSDHVSDAQSVGHLPGVSEDLLSTDACF